MKLVWESEIPHQNATIDNLLFTYKNMLLKMGRNAVFGTDCLVYSIMNNIGPLITLKDC
jgi:hypothetical protein